MGTAHKICSFNLEWMASGKPKDLGSWMLTDEGIIHARTGAVISFALDRLWTTQWLAWCHGGRHIIRLQSHRHLRQRLLCTLDAATGHIVAGPRECAPGNLEASDCFGHGVEDLVSSTADVILVPEQTPAIMMLHLPSLRQIARVICPLAGIQGSCAASWTRTNLFAVIWYGKIPSLVLTVHSGSEGQALHTLVLEAEPTSAPCFLYLSFSMAPQGAHAVLNYHLRGISMDSKSLILDVFDGTQGSLLSASGVILRGVRCCWSPSGQHFCVREYMPDRHDIAGCTLGLYALGLASPIWEHSGDHDPPVVTGWTVLLFAAQLWSQSHLAQAFRQQGGPGLA